MLKRFFLSLLLLLFAVTTAIFICGCNKNNGNNSGDSVLNSGIDNSQHNSVQDGTEEFFFELSTYSVSIDLYDEFTLKIVDSNEKIEPDEVEWKSDNTSVATIENGVITGLAVGSAEISVTVKDLLNKTEVPLS